MSRDEPKLLGPHLFRDPDRQVPGHGTLPGRTPALK